MMKILIYCIKFKDLLQYLVRHNVPDKLEEIYQPDAANGEMEQILFKGLTRGWNRSCGEGTTTIVNGTITKTSWDRVKRLANKINPVKMGCPDEIDAIIFDGFFRIP